MASLSTEKSKITGKVTGRRIQFVDGNRDRKSIRLGLMPAKAAESVLAKVEELNALAISGTSWGPALARWVGELPAQLHDKLSAVGLVPKRAEVEKATLGPFLEAYAAGRTDVQAGTAQVHAAAAHNLVDFFGADKKIADVNEADAVDFRRWLEREGKVASDGKRGPLSPNTVRKKCSVAKQFFAHAIKRRLIVSNPFAMKDIGFKANRERDYYVTRPEVEKVIAAAPDLEWRVIIALARFGGLRCPSETLALRWGDINWETGVINVRSPKTQHHEGHESRQVPIFPELKPFLEAAWDAAPVGSEYVIIKHRGQKKNLRTALATIIVRAGLTPWPKPFQNMRSSRATELAAAFPGHVAAGWLGHSELVAMKHYWRTTDADIQKALTTPTGPVQNPVQSATEIAREEPSSSKAPLVIPENNQALQECTTVQTLFQGIEAEIFDWSREDVVGLEGGGLGLRGARRAHHDAVSFHFHHDDRLSGVDGDPLADGVEQFAVDQHSAAGEHQRLGDADAADQRSTGIVRASFLLAGKFPQNRPAHGGLGPKLEREADGERHGYNGDRCEAEPGRDVVVERDDHARHEGDEGEEAQEPAGRDEDFQD